MPRSWEPQQLRRRLAVFIEGGLMGKLPTQWQIFQGTLEMSPYVLSSDAVDERRYQGAPLAHPLLRQSVLLWASGRDHARVGPALDAKLNAICQHLYLTYHGGMPVFDLQVLQTHEGGLEHFRSRVEEMLVGQSPWARKMRRLQALILPRGDEYLSEFLGEDGWIARAQRLEYPKPAAEDSRFPVEFFSLVEFLNHRATAYAPDRSGLSLVRTPGHLFTLLMRRFREGRSLGWLPGHHRKLELKSGD